MVTMQQTVTTHKDVQNDVDSNTSKTVIKIGLAVQIELKGAALHIKAVKKKQINKQVKLKHKSEKPRKYTYEHALTTHKNITEVAVNFGENGTTDDQHAQL